MDISFKEWLADCEIIRLIETILYAEDVEFQSAMTGTDMELNSLLGTKGIKYFGLIFMAMPKWLKSADKVDKTTEVAGEIAMTLRNPQDEMYKYIFTGHENRPPIMAEPDPTKKENALKAYITYRARQIAGHLTKKTVFQSKMKNTSTLDKGDQTYLGNIPDKVSPDQNENLLNKMRELVGNEFERLYQEAKNKAKKAHFFVTKQIAEKRLETLPEKLQPIGALMDMVWRLPPSPTVPDGLSMVISSKGTMSGHIGEIDKIMKTVLTNLTSNKIPAIKKVG